MNEQDHINELFQRYINNRCTPEEIFFLLQFFDIDENETLLKELIRNELDKSTNVSFEQDRTHLDVLYNKITNVIGEEQAKDRKRLYTFMRVAAAFILISAISFIIYTYRTDWFKNNDTDTFPNIAMTNELQPEGNKTILTLHNGKQIVLNEIEEGETVRELGMIISKSKEGRIIYGIDSERLTDRSDKKYPLNTITVPRGAKYEVVLADGTKIWLNSASTLTFPPTFSEKERKVELIGEAYFEVAQNKAKPFLVSTPQYQVEVLGTHFNIKAYPDEQISQTTLLEGAVKVKKEGKELLLTPGQQAEIVTEEKDITEHTANLEKVMAWKNGVFFFDGEELEQVMQQIARWYDVEIIYEKEIPSVILAGMVSREDSLERLLGILEKAGKVNFTIEGNKITVR